MDVQEGQRVPKDIDVFQMKVSFIISTFYCCSTNGTSHALLKVHRGWAFAFDKFFMCLQHGQRHCTAAALQQKMGNMYLPFFKERLSSKHILFLLVRHAGLLFSIFKF